MRPAIVALLFSALLFGACEDSVCGGEFEQSAEERSGLYEVEPTSLAAQGFADGTIEVTRERVVVEYSVEGVMYRAEYAIVSEG